MSMPLNTGKPDDYLLTSFSSLGVLDFCPRKFEFYKLYPRNRIWEDAYAADCGSALHAGYQEYLKSQDSDKALWAFLKAFPYRLEYQEKNDYRSLEACMATLDELESYGYMKDYELAEIKKPDGTVVDAIEVPFEIRFTDLILPDGRGLAYTGYIDAIMQHVKSRRFRTLDIKTNRATGQDKEGRYKFDSQQDPYGLIVEQLQGNSKESFDVLFLDAYIDIVDPKVQMWPYERSHERMQEWLLDIVLKFQQLNQYMQLEHFPRTGHGCLSWNRACPYLDPCESRDKPTITEWFLQGADEAKDKPWEPWVVYEIEAYGGIGE